MYLHLNWLPLLLFFLLFTIGIFSMRIWKIPGNRYRTTIHYVYVCSCCGEWNTLNFKKLYMSLIGDNVIMDEVPTTQWWQQWCRWLWFGPFSQSIGKLALMFNVLYYLECVMCSYWLCLSMFETRVKLKGWAHERCRVILTLYLVSCGWPRGYGSVDDLVNVLSVVQTDGIDTVVDLCKDFTIPRPGRGYVRVVPDVHEQSLVVSR